MHKMIGQLHEKGKVSSQKKENAFMHNAVQGTGKKYHKYDLWTSHTTKCMQFPLKKKRKKYCSFCFFLLQCNYVMLGNFFLNERTIAIRLSWKTLCIFSRQNGTRQKWQELLDIIRHIAFQHHFTKTVCPIHILASRNRRIKRIKGKSTQKN